MPITILGTSDNDFLQSGAEDDPNAYFDYIITGLEGDDTILVGFRPGQVFAGAGNDYISGGFSGDQLIGGDGADQIFGNGGADYIQGDAGNDIIQAGWGWDTVYGGDGDDVITGLGFSATGDASFGDNDTLVGGAGNDIITGDTGVDLLIGDEGDDLLEGGWGNDTVYGGDGNDILRGEGYSLHGSAAEGTTDILFGGNGNDELYGGVGDDYLYGDTNYVENNTRIVRPAGDDMLFGGAGNDWLFGFAGDDTLNGDAGDDLLFGGLGNDVIYDLIGNNVISSGRGADFVQTGDGNDIIYDGGYADFIAPQRGEPDLLGIDSPLTYTYSRFGYVGSFGYDPYNGQTPPEHFVALTRNFGPGDTIISGAGDDEIYASLYSNAIFDGAGNDYVDGGGGHDLLHMGAGQDTVILEGTKSLGYVGPGHGWVGSVGIYNRATFQPETLIYDDIDGVSGGSLDHIYNFDAEDGDRILYEDAFGTDVTFADDGNGNALLANGEGVFAVFYELTAAELEVAFDYF